jgi:hypothetical protein
VCVCVCVCVYVRVCGTVRVHYVESGHAAPPPGRRKKARLGRGTSALNVAHSHKRLRAWALECGAVSASVFYSPTPPRLNAVSVE